MRTDSNPTRPGRKLLPLFSALGLGLGLSLGLAACTHLPDGPSDAAATDGAPLTAIQRGQAVAKKSNCAIRHNPENSPDVTLAGQMTARPGTMAYGANLTPDPTTGIAGWSDDAIINAVRTGVDDSGAELCTTMPRFASMTDADAHDLVAYLRSLKPVQRAIPESTCPPIKPKPEDGGTHD